MEKKVVLIGLGIMGYRIAANFKKAGMLNGVFDRKIEKAEAFSKQFGSEFYKDIESAVKSNDVIVTMLYDDSSVIDVYSKAMDYAAGKIFVDMSTISPETSIRVSKDIESKGGEMYDAPVIGTSVVVEKKGLTVLIGGPRDNVGLIEELMGATATSVVYVGPNGSGLYAKLVNNLFLGSYMEALAEAVRFGRSTGLDDNVISSVLIKYSSARSPTSELKVPKMMAGDHSTQFSVKNMLKDLEIIEDTARRKSVPIPSASIALQFYRYLASSGHSEEDISSIYKVLTGS
ncbi:hypothetical protein [Thermoplasma volcanium GSS1]|uniref:3-hydroxyisobutyrate dehydrogenase n=1 Tax=Thermoplasma volcanium (strain ATCC 51530 / DSM 4299 / JCM 9571 / NBRC 15438 / GSS1) TaxID=273116 RepID=Q97C72_THEVO|nr:NAD(P)-dependent oxidoreductase [Thermoplasma volcanium]BAB59374.1 hypothetical protein [Thermoplasma volcanium GSS1]